MFSVIERDTGRWIDRVGPWELKGWPGHEIGYGLLRGAWGMAYAFEAASASIDWVLGRLRWIEFIHVIKA